MAQEMIGLTERTVTGEPLAIVLSRAASTKERVINQKSLAIIYTVYKCLKTKVV